MKAVGLAPMVALGLLACASPPSETMHRPELIAKPLGEEAEPSIPRSARTFGAWAVGPSELSGSNGKSEAILKYGTGVFARPPRTAPRTPPPDDGRSFQFRDAPLDVVLDQVLGEAFGASFVVDPGIDVRLSLRLENLSDLQDAISTLNAALGSQDITLRSVGGSYVATQSSRREGNRRSRAIQVLSANEEVVAETVVYHLSDGDAVAIRDLVAPLLNPDTIKSIDADRGLLTLQGARADVAAGVDLIRAFDVDWFAATSSALIPLREADSETVKAELDAILARSGGFETVSLPRLNAVMVFARSRALLDRAQGLVARLDARAASRTAQDTLFYRARYVSPQRLQAMALAMGRPATDSSAPPLSEADAALPFSPREGLAIAIDEPSGLLVVTGEPSDLDRVQALFAEMDAPRDQILIDVTVVEVTLRDEFRFGVQWSGLEGLADFIFVDNDTGDLTRRFPGASIAYANVDIAAVLNVLDSETDIEIVSSPRVLALNNETASINVGSQVPIITQSAVSVIDPGAPIVNSTEYRDTGVILEVTPRVLAGGLVEIVLSQEVSDVVESVTPGIVTPTFSTREVNSVLAVPDGATLALGGLISTNRSQTRIGVPGLSDAPVVGRLFSSTSDVVRRTELIVLVRPQIVRATTDELDLTQNLIDALARFRASLEPTS